MEGFTSAEWLARPLHIRDVPDANGGMVTDNPDGDYSLFCSVPPGK
jgi:hypothetical protein